MTTSKKMNYYYIFIILDAKEYRDFYNQAILLP